MGRFNPANYKPEQDSSIHSLWADVSGATGTVVLVTGVRRCKCGCFQDTAGKSLFRMGHDARLKGKLLRAHLSNTFITRVFHNDNSVDVEELTAMQVANELGWAHYLSAAQEREELRAAERAKRSNSAITARAMGPQVGDRRLIKVGRWSYTGQILAIYDNGRELELEYTTKQGDTRTVRRPKNETEEAK